MEIKEIVLITVEKVDNLPRGLYITSAYFIFSGKNRKKKMLNPYLKFLLCLSVVVLSVSVSGKETVEADKSDDDVIELQVSPQMRDRVKRAFERGKVFDEGDVTVVELDEENSSGILSQNDDAIVIAPPEDRSSRPRTPTLSWWLLRTPRFIPSSCPMTSLCSALALPSTTT